MENIKIIRGDITTAKVDAIVNAANETLMGGGGVDGAIHSKAGYKLLEECEKIDVINGVRCPFGEARITGAGNLDAKYVIHTVGPIYFEMKEKADELLKNAYKNSLDLAREKECKSIAIPAISCGVYGFPIAKAAKIAVDVCKLYDDLEVIFYLHGERTYNAWQRAINEKTIKNDDETNKKNTSIGKKIKKFFSNILNKEQI